MPAVYGDDLDLQGFKVLNALFQNLTTAPAHASGRFYWDPTAKKLYVSDGAAWLSWDSIADDSVTAAKILDGTITNAEIATAANIALSKLATDPLARANHTGTQLAATISNFVATVQTVRLDQLAVPTAAVALNSQQLTGLAAGTTATHAVNYQQLQDAKNNIDRKESVRVGTGTNITLSAPGASLDGVTMVAGESFLAYSQTAGAENGIYLWNGAAVAATRRDDADASAEVTAGMQTVVEEGTMADKRALLTTNNPITLGTTALAFTFESTGETILGGAGLLKSGGTLDVVAANTTITVNADSVQVNTGVISRRASATIGDGTATSYTITHSFGTLAVGVTVRRLSDGEEIHIGNRASDTNNVIVTFGTAPASNSHNVLITA